MHRYFYNKSVAEINTRYSNKKKEFEDHPSCVLCNNPKISNNYTCGNHSNEGLPWNLKINHQSIREAVMKTNKEIKNDHPELLWQLDVPYNIRELGSKSACNSYSTAVVNKIAGNIKNFSLSFCKKNKPSKHFVLPGTLMYLKEKCIDICPQKLKQNCSLRIDPHKKKILKEIYNSNGGKFNFTTVVCDRKHYYLMITGPIKKEKIIKNDNRANVISLDPGQVTPLAGYAPDKKLCINIGENVMKQITNLNNRIDIIRSALDNVKNQSKTGCKKTYKRKLRGLKNKIRKYEFKISSIKSNFHIYTAVSLTRGWKNIILPEFETSDMQKKDSLASTVKRKLNDIAHYQLKEKIKYFAWKHNSNLQIVTEHYTSKTCPSCGHLNNQEIKNRIFKCSECDVYGPRDFIGAANILIKTFSENKVVNKK